MGASGLRPHPDAALGQALGIFLDWTVALLSRPDVTKVELEVERDAARRGLETAASIDARRSTPLSPP